MRVHSIVAFLSVLVWAHVLAREETSSRLSLPDLQRALNGHLQQKKFESAHWGIKVVSLGSGAPVFETNSQKLLKPASNAKVFTAALALDVLRPETRIRTSLLAKQEPDARGVLAGDLIIYGRGDPTLSARFQNGNYSNILGRLVDKIRTAGVKEISGDLIGDETFFTGPRMGSGWTWDDLQYYYGAEVSALSVQDNVVDLSILPGTKPGDPCRVVLKPETTYLQFSNRTRTTGTNVPAGISVTRPLAGRHVQITGTLPVKYGTYVDAVTVPNPALWFVEMLRDELQRAGITVRGAPRSRSSPDEPKLDPEAFREIGFVESVPLREIVSNMLKPSQNLYAQLLLLQVGARSPTRAKTTESAGVREMQAFLKRAGIDPAEVLLEEGSGLSRSSLVTPNAQLELLKFMAKHPQANLFRESLPGPGEGTLRTRFRDWREAQGGNQIELRAKTGSLQYVSTLSGYLRSAAGENLAFVVFLNGYEGSTSARDEVETVVRLLSRLEARK